MNLSCEREECSRRDGKRSYLSEGEETKMRKPNAMTGNMVCVRLPGPLSESPDEHNLIQTRLHFSYAIEVPIKVFGPEKSLWVRLSAWMYNEMEDYERLGDAMEQVRGRMEVNGGHAVEIGEEGCDVVETREQWRKKRQGAVSTVNEAGATQTSSEKSSSSAASSDSPLKTTTLSAPSSASGTTTTVSSSSSFFAPTPSLLLRPDHTQICIPPGQEARAREFYIGLLGMQEVERPKELEKSGGFWMYCGPEIKKELGEHLHANVHIGTEDVPSDHYARSKAHIAYSVKNLAGWREKLSSAGFPTEPGRPIEGLERFDTRDPFGNRVELIEYSVDPALPRPISKTYFWRSKEAYEKGKVILKVAVFQGQAVPAEVAENMKIIHEQMRVAAEKGVHLILFSELFLTGYALSREDTHRLAMEQTSSTIQQLQQWCQKFKVAICMGYPELVLQSVHPASPTAANCSCCNPTERRCVYNSAILIDDEGQILISYRKAHLSVHARNSYCDLVMKLHIRSHSFCCFTPPFPSSHLFLAGGNWSRRASSLRAHRSS